MKYYAEKSPPTAIQVVMYGSLPIIAFRNIAQQKKGKRRVPERTLLLLSFLGGCVGALLGMVLCRHKTKHAKFLFLVPLSVVLWAIALGALIAHRLGAF